jgi:hypothetical protein
MSLSVYSVFVLGSDLAKADHSSKESYRTSFRLRTESETKHFTDALCSKRE